MYALAIANVADASTSCKKDPDGVSVPDPSVEYADINITTYGILPFPSTPYELTDCRTNLGLSTTFTSPANPTVPFVSTSKYNEAFARFRYSVASVAKIDPSGDVASGDGGGVSDEDMQHGLEIAAGVGLIGVGIATGNPATVITGLMSIVTGAVGFSDDPKDNNGDVKDNQAVLASNQQILADNQQLLLNNQQVMLEGIVNLGKMVEENQLYLIDIENLINNLGNKIGWISAYNAIHSDVIFIKDTYECYLLVISETKTIQSTCCESPKDRETCRTELAKSILATDHSPTIIQSHKSVFSKATGSSYYTEIPMPDDNLLYNWGKLTWEYGKVASVWNVYSSSWFKDYIDIANRIGQILFKSSRLLVWASATRDGALSEQAKAQWMDRAKDLLSYSYYVYNYIPEIIKTVYQPSQIMFSTQCTAKSDGSSDYTCGTTSVENTFTEKYMEARNDSMSTACTTESGGQTRHFYSHWSEYDGQQLLDTRDEYPWTLKETDYVKVSFTPSSSDALSLSVGGTSIGLGLKNGDQMFYVPDASSATTFELVLPSYIESLSQRAGHFLLSSGEQITYIDSVNSCMVLSTFLVSKPDGKSGYLRLVDSTVSDSSKASAFSANGVNDFFNDVYDECTYISHTVHHHEFKIPTDHCIKDEDEEISYKFVCYDEHPHVKVYKNGGCNGFEDNIHLYHDYFGVDGDNASSIDYNCIGSSMNCPGIEYVHIYAFGDRSNNCYGNNGMTNTIPLIMEDCDESDIVDNVDGCVITTCNLDPGSSAAASSESCAESSNHGILTVVLLALVILVIVLLIYLIIRTNRNQNGHYNRVQMNSDTDNL